MNDLQEEIDFLKGEINSLKGRIGAGGNEVQRHKLSMLKRLLLRCEASQSRRAG
ncbi:hypothetical protein [Agrobacterium cavarae]|uniref:hypothetical protein n=1 Tax=Agrobacterium cavarae TaxID=2528239 RepID=UPI003D04836C